MPDQPNSIQLQSKPPKVTVRTLSQSKNLGPPCRPYSECASKVNSTLSLSSSTWKQLKPCFPLSQNTTSLRCRWSKVFGLNTLKSPKAMCSPKMPSIKLSSLFWASLSKNKLWVPSTVTSTLKLRHSSLARSRVLIQMASLGWRLRPTPRNTSANISSTSCARKMKDSQSY